MDRPRLYVDFNEMVEPDLVLLAQEDGKVDSSGNTVVLRDGLAVHVYMDDVDENGRRGVLIADGVVEKSPGTGWTAPARWCCRINADGILRLEGDSDNRTGEDMMAAEEGISNGELERIEQLCRAATPPPWRSFVEGRDHESGSDFIQTPGDGIELSGASRADQDFIASARQDVPRLVAEVRRLRSAGLAAKG